MVRVPRSLIQNGVQPLALQVWVILVKHSLFAVLLRQGIGYFGYLFEHSCVFCWLQPAGGCQFDFGST